MENRTLRQCKERWFNYLQPGVNSNPWTKEEDIRLAEMVKNFGNSWSKIKQYFPRRTDVNIKNRWSKLSQLMKQPIKKVERKEEKPIPKDANVFDICSIPANGFDVFDQWGPLEYWHI